ncbi:exonuclease SbcCD subunit D [Flexivirga oryzae]|uniref:Nuclease SbcCD subunit D n=1 Tax=Flexivirga oryzae TaxID=1794944 RepID=A0A839N327_9MICO|nr:exonuclease SbcCD subunit D C-terminal domain-containing protein [Flexivirga oryzae]MBB2891717.1 exonuclease SbcD [Flexivirga oryzae]
MRFLHTSDWHLGRRFHGASLLTAQARYLDHLVQTVRAERVDAVLVAGDVYDRALPAPDSIELLDENLARLRDAGAAVVLSSGNHDSAIRLGFGSRVLEHGGVHIRTRVGSVGRPVLLGDVAIYPLPYLEPALTAPALDATEPTHAGVLRAAMRRVHADLIGRNVPGVVMAHAFVVGATSCESERDISVGGASAVPAATFSGLAYAALGHLHGAQQVGEVGRYSGSPVAMSFSEATQRKSSVLVDISDGEVTTQLVDAPVDRPLAILRGTLAELLSDPGLAHAEDSWCQVTLTDATRPLGAMEQLRRRFPHTAQLLFDQPVPRLQGARYTARVAGRGTLDLCCDFLAHTRDGAGPTDDERRLLRTAVEATRVAGDAHEGPARTRAVDGVA